MFTLGYSRSTADLLRRMGENKTTFGVTSLSLDGVRDLTSLVHVKTSFPHLKRLELPFWYEEEAPLGPTLKACSPLGLTHLYVTFHDYPEKLLEFVDSFVSNEDLFKTLKVLSITRDNVRRCLDGGDDLFENPEGMNFMNEFVLTLSGMQRVVIFNPIFEKEVWWDRILPCIQENNVPLEFMGWPKRDANNELYCSDEFLPADFNLPK